MDHYSNFSINRLIDFKNSLIQMKLGLQKQMPITNFETVIVGLGETGLSVAAYLNRQGQSFVMLDTRKNPPQLETFKQRFPDIEVYLGELSDKLFAQAKQIFVSPGVDFNNQLIQSARAQGVVCSGDIELFVSSTDIPIVAITGSNGKSTVTSLVKQMGQAAGTKTYAGGNLGPPALELLKYDDAELFVLELSSFQLESTPSPSTYVSAVLNISADHLDRHGNVDHYASIKEQIFLNAKFSVVNRDDALVANMKTGNERISFGLDYPATGSFGLIRAGKHLFLAKGNDRLLATNKLALPGESGILNSLAALTIGDVLGLPIEKMLLTLTTFKGLPHRFALVGKWRGVSWFNDSKGTNIGAAISSLRSLKDNIILLAGGIFKGGDLKLLRAAVSKHAKHVILFGQDANVLAQALHEAAQIHCVNSMRDAVNKARELAIAGDKVLLSPACASFDMYKNYIARGQDFEACVQELAV